MSIELEEMEVFRSFSWLIVAVSMLMGACGAKAQMDSAAAEALMRSSGLWQQMTSIAPQVNEGLLEAISQNGSTPSPSEIDRITKSVQAAYSVDRLRSKAMVIFEKELRPEHMPAVSRWYESPVGKLITGLEESATADQANPEVALQDGTARLSSMPADRRAILNELVVVTRSAEAIAQITIDISLAAQRGASSVMANAPPVSADDLRSALEAQRPQMLQTFAQYALAGYANAYATLPTPQLRQYVEFLSSDAGKHFTEVGLRAFSAALVDASTDFGRRLPGSKDRAST